MPVGSAPTAVGGATVLLDDDALQIARAAAAAEAGGIELVGDAVDAYGEDPVTVTARFQARLAGYRGWLWSVTVALVDAKRPTVSEVTLLPGPDALLAPAWVPWEQRVRSGDLGVGDLLPSAPDDPRLVPAYAESDDPAVEQVAHELGIGRVRVMSREGRADSAERWHGGAFGPDDDMAKHAPAQCATCAFYLPLAGSLGAAFGACGNEYSPADGRVVDAGYGCGAHSEAIGAGRSKASDAVVDELLLDVYQRPAETLSGEPISLGQVSAEPISAESPPAGPVPDEIDRGEDHADHADDDNDDNDDNDDDGDPGAWPTG